jgi:hypothetical protein
MAKLGEASGAEEAQMGTKHKLKYHLAAPVGIMVVLLLVGVPFGTAFVVGMMSDVEAFSRPAIPDC